MQVPGCPDPIPRAAAQEPPDLILSTNIAQEQESHEPLTTQYGMVSNPVVSKVY